MFRTARSCLPAALAAGVLLTVAPAQELSLSRVITTTPLLLTASAGAATAVPVSLPAGSDITAGLSLSSFVPGADAGLQAAFSFATNTFAAHLLGQLGTLPFVAPDAAASYGRAGIVVELSAPRPMKLRLVLMASDFAVPGTQPVHAEIDVGNDGSSELQFTNPGGGCADSNRILFVDVPAGLFCVGIVVEGSLRAPRSDSCVLTSLQARFTVEPAHADVAYDGPFCGGSILAIPRLDGETVSFAVGPQYLGGLSWLVFGAAATQTPLLPSSSCNLLVTPDVIVPMPTWSMLDLPLARLGMSHWFVQGVSFQPQFFMQPPTQLHTSMRGSLRIR